MPVPRRTVTLRHDGLLRRLVVRGVSTSSSGVGGPVGAAEERVAHRCAPRDAERVGEDRGWCVAGEFAPCGVRSARPVSNSSAASPTIGMAGAGPSPTPRAVKSASRWPRQPVGFCQHRPQQLVQPGERKLRLARHPPQASTRIPASAARREAAATRADFPIPGSPSTSSDPPPSAIPASSDSTTAIPRPARPALTPSTAAPGRGHPRSLNDQARPRQATVPRRPLVRRDDLGAPTNHRVDANTARAPPARTIPGYARPLPGPPASRLSRRRLSEVVCR